MPALKQIAPQKLERRLAYFLSDVLPKGYLNVRGHVSANVRGFCEWLRQSRSDQSENAMGHGRPGCRSTVAMPHVFRL